MSHRTRVTERTGTLPATTYGQLPHPSRVARPPLEKISTAFHRFSMTSNSSSGRRSSTSFDGVSTSSHARQSGIPRPTRSTPGTRIGKLNSSRQSTIYLHNSKPVTTNIAGMTNRIAAQNTTKERVTPSDITAKIVSNNDEDDMLSLESQSLSLDMDHDTVLGMAIPYKQIVDQTSLPPRLIPELRALAATTQGRPKPAMSTIITVSSPSTQTTTSPSPWSASTTTTTPTSWLSASPSVVQPIRSQSVNKKSQIITITPTLKTAVPKLPVLQESVTSSATSLRDHVRKEELQTTKKRKNKTSLNSPAPTPPPRISSSKGSRSRDYDRIDEPQLPGPISNTFQLRGREAGLVGKQVDEVASRQKQAPTANTLASRHNRLPNAIRTKPPRPSRDGTEELDLRIPQPVNVNRTRYRAQQRQLLEAAPVEALYEAAPQTSSQYEERCESESVAPNTPSRSRLAKFSKLALFGKSSKSTTIEISSPQRKILQRKGPAAGTGHEGYGKFVKRERRVSGDGNTTGTDSESSVISTKRKLMRSVPRKESSAGNRRSSASQSDLDDFASSRLQPVVMLGGSQRPIGGLYSNSLDPAATLIDITDDEEAWNGKPTNTDAGRKTSVPSSGPLLRESRLISHLDSLDASDQPIPTSGHPSSLERYVDIRRSEHVSTTTIPNPPYLSGYHTSQSSVAATSIAATDASNDLHKISSNQSEKSKKSRRINWGFFKRKRVVPESSQLQTSNRTDAPQMAVRISSVQPARPVPYYAMLESDNDTTTTDAIGDFLTEAARAMPTANELSGDEIDADPEAVPQRTSILLPTVPQLDRGIATRRRSDSNTSQSKRQPVVESLPSTQPVLRQRQPRLVQVGRIPKVVQTTHSLAPALSAFSQPQPAELICGPGKPLPQPSNSVSTLPSDSTASTSNRTLWHAHTNGTSAHGNFPQSMLTYQQSSYEVSQNRDRYSTASSSSDGVQSVMCPPLLPAANFPLRSLRNTTTDDDIWDEYDDFIDHVISPPRLKKSKTRIRDEDKSNSTLSCRYENLHQQPQAIRTAIRSLAVDTSIAPPRMFLKSSVPPKEPKGDEASAIRRSRIVSALHSSLDPSSPFSIGDYFAELEDSKRNSSRTSGSPSSSTIGQDDLRSPQTAITIPDPTFTEPQYQHHENARHMDKMERSKDPVRYAERSYASLMVSRWLSFGRVLFSPAHSDVQQQEERHVLVIDGLGTEDWSIYCAVNYASDQAIIYDLKETGRTRSPNDQSKAAHTPQNLRRREIASFTDAFKFPDSFFSVIVLRFPPMMSESKMKNIISECRRVLAPGGYIELMLLDLDIVNMGILTRRAMRELKIKIAMHNREVSLKPVIDNIQRVLGERGFSKLSKCVVGVPVVGRPPGSESPTSSRSSGTSDRFHRSPGTAPLPLDGINPHKYSNFSLNDLVADHSDNADAKIGRMVSRTARSWWQHCFEATVISDGDLARSILTNKQVLNECKSRASSFKLLIAYAQKPMTPAISTRRRTVSEPVIATLATAGTP